jgi:hypothetical protein
VIAQKNEERRKEDHGKNYCSKTRLVHQLLHKALSTLDVSSRKKPAKIGDVARIYSIAPEMSWLQEFRSGDSG